MSQCAGVWAEADKLTRQLTAGVHRRAKFFKDARVMFPFCKKDGRQDNGRGVQHCLSSFKCDFEKNKLNK